MAMTTNNIATISTTTTTTTTITSILLLALLARVLLLILHYHHNNDYNYYHSNKNKNNNDYQHTNTTSITSITNHHHHHHVVPLARISLTLSRHFSLSFIASGRSSGLYSVSSHSSWMYVRAGRPAFARPYVLVYKSTSLMSSSLLLQQCPACLFRLAWIVSW